MVLGFWKVKHGNYRVATVVPGSSDVSEYKLSISVGCATISFLSLSFKMLQDSVFGYEFFFVSVGSFKVISFTLVPAITLEQ